MLFGEKGRVGNRSCRTFIRLVTGVFLNHYARSTRTSRLSYAALRTIVNKHGGSLPEKQSDVAIKVDSAAEKIMALNPEVTVKKIS
jgi:hypothetical protein